MAQSPSRAFGVIVNSRIAVRRSEQYAVSVVYAARRGYVPRLLSTRVCSGDRPFSAVCDHRIPQIYHSEHKEQYKYPHGETHIALQLLFHLSPFLIRIVSHHRRGNRRTVRVSDRPSSLFPPRPPARSLSRRPELFPSASGSRP